jgi:O-antigen ligase
MIFSVAAQRPLGTQPLLGTAPPRISRAVFTLASAIGSLQLFNFLNYSNLREFADFPVIRAGALITLTAVLFLAGARHLLSYHLSRQWDIYLFCFICLATTAISVQPSQTLMYGTWLILSCYATLELGRRVETIQELQAVLLIVIVPTAAVSFVIYLLFGPTVLHTGRVFGGLGTGHVDVAIVLDFSLVLLAIYSLKGDRLVVPRILRWLALPLIAYSGYLIVFGLTRSVWLSFAISVFLFLATSVRRAAIAGVAIVISVLVLEAAGLAAVGLLPDAVKGRIELTQKRAESGEIDPRLHGWRFAMETVTAHPEGYGYAAGIKTHNSYFDVLVGAGLAGFAVMLLVIGRSAHNCSRLPAPYFRFFLIGAGGLLTHAIFEVQSTPGQANFLPLVTWLAMTRSAFVLSQQKQTVVSGARRLTETPLNGRPAPAKRS